MELITGFFWCCAVTAVAFYVHSWRRRARGPDLPGPKGYPLIGTILPRDSPWIQMTKYSRQYGPVYGLNILSTRTVVISSVRAARELLETRSSIYSNRIPPKMAELCGLDEGVLFQTHNGRLRQARRLLALGLQPRELEAYQTSMQHATIRFLADLLRDPANFLSHIHGVPTDVSLEIAYGYTAKGDDDPFVDRITNIARCFEKSAAFSIDEGYVVNWFPFLSKLPSFFPGMSFRKVAQTWRSENMAAFSEGLERVRSEVTEGVARQSVLSRAFGDHSGLFEEDVMLRCAPQLFTGGSDTTISALSTFFLAMMLYPEAQKRAQEELDRVVGPDRLPTFADWPNLPYVTGLLRETIRWHTPIPCAYRNPVKDDLYEGYFIEKDSTVLVNFWGMLYNEESFPDPGEFRPERWSDVSLHGDKDVDPFEFAFGFGRRLCPGKYMAQELLFMTIANTLATFNIRKCKDVNGVEITPDAKYTNGSIVAPLPFDCEVTPRATQTLLLVEHALNALA
ncbi:cytochrome P450 [Cristinia sonorae]|uniref:Cytochrome P450 n=1 Tax=Cristinia sonorae TaxID=1940300 RepID=A0A8K0XPG4_9AGAR|nr:cytochrome P450 [Cristinia sonorae]